MGIVCFDAGGCAVRVLAREAPGDLGSVAKRVAVESGLLVADPWRSHRSDLPSVGAGGDGASFHHYDSRGHVDPKRNIRSEQAKIGPEIIREMQRWSKTCR